MPSRPPDPSACARPPCWAAALLGLLLACGASAAEDDPPTPSPWALSGFGTLGYVSQSGNRDWRFVRNYGQRGASSLNSATEDSRLGVQLNWNGGPQWEAAVQGVWMHRPLGAKVSESIEWAYVAHRPQPHLRLRLGRISPDMFLFSDSRNVGFALPWARPPVDFYAFMPMASVDGGDLEKQWQQGGANWRVRGTLGRFNSTAADNVTGKSFRVRGRDLASLTLSREADGLLLRAGWLRTRLNVDVYGDLAPLRQGLDQLSQLPLPGMAEQVAPLQSALWNDGSITYYSLGMQYEAGPWGLHAEASRLEVDGSLLPANRGYASVSYRHGNLTFMGFASRVLPSKPALVAPPLGSQLAPVIGPAGAAQADMMAGIATRLGNSYRSDQSSIGLGLRWDVTPNTALRLQVDRVNTHPNGSASWRRSTADAAHTTLTSALVDFVWGP